MNKTLRKKLFLFISDYICSLKEKYLKAIIKYII